MTFNETLGILTSEFEKFVSTKTVIGEPFVIGDITLIPLITAMAGIGGGGGEGNATKDSRGAEGTGLGIGGGFRVSPTAVVVIKEDGVSVLPVSSKAGVLDKLFETLPTLAAKMGKHKEKHGDETCSECCEDEEN